jgi:hypothetical protein
MSDDSLQSLGTAVAKNIISDIEIFKDWSGNLN